MKRSLQLFVFVVAISMVLASSGPQLGCRVGRTYAVGCIKCVCEDGNPFCEPQTQRPCLDEGSQFDFYIYEDPIEPPHASDVLSKSQKSN